MDISLIENFNNFFEIYRGCTDDIVDVKMLSKTRAAWLSPTLNTSAIALVAQKLYGIFTKINIKIKLITYKSKWLI